VTRPAPPPFVLKVDPVEPERHGTVDLYLPAGVAGPRPAVVFVHGGPRRAGRIPTPRDWPMFRGYGSLAAERGVVGVTVDHRLHDPSAYPLAAADVAAAVDLARADPRVDPSRVALWFFSGGGPLSAGWLRDPPEWLRCIGLTYPLLAVPDGTVEGRFRPVEAVEAVGAAAAAGVAGAMRAATLPIVLTRAGLERPAAAATVAGFVAAAERAGAALEIIDVPNGQHAFDVLDHTDGSRAAVTDAVDRVVGHLSAR
jgi:acetyl esterase/lipase